MKKMRKNKEAELNGKSNVKSYQIKLQLQTKKYFKLRQKNNSKNKPK